jgi:hypothetical protein
MLNAISLHDNFAKQKTTINGCVHYTLNASSIGTCAAWLANKKQYNRDNFLLQNQGAS